VRLKLALVGGGLANSLIAYRILAKDPSFPLLIVERNPSLGTNHTWSFHESDLTPERRHWMQPLITNSWPKHELRFPRRRRIMENGYNTVTSENLQRVVGPLLGDRCLLGVQVLDLSPTEITLDDGTRIQADTVIDGRGDPGEHHLDIAFQKFLGRFVRLAEPHGLSGPILMDATVEQTDGYRFIYTLPFSDSDLLIEDTYYADDPALDRPRLRTGIERYAAEQGWTIAAITGEEAGVLPIVLGGDIKAFWDAGPEGVARSGMRGAFFHPTTGYSLPEGVRLADELAAGPDLESASLFEFTRRRSEELWRHTGYYRLLNRMLFRAAEPDLRYRIFERFYGLSGDLIRRFYAGRLKWTDKVRLLIGKPPVPVHRALRCLFENRRARSKLSSSKRGGQ
jgi:lycopene beta-cyclase